MTSGRFLFNRAGRALMSCSLSLSLLLSACADKPADTSFEAAAPVLPRLTQAQYRNTIEDVFGGSLPLTVLEPDTNPSLFYTIGASSTEVSSYGVEQYGESARAIAAAVFSDQQRLYSLMNCVPQTGDDACVREFIGQLGRRLFRRPLTEAQVDRYVQLSRSHTEDSPYEGLETVVAAMLQSPNFLYRVSVGEPDPGAPGGQRYTGWEMAERLSFLITNSGPDEHLLDAAASGALYTDQGLSVHVERLLKTPRAREAVMAFFSQYLDLWRLEFIERDEETHPLYTPQLMLDMEHEVRLLVQDIVFENPQDIRTLFSAPRSMVNAPLAELYGVDAPGATDSEFVPVTFGTGTPRAGVLTLGAFLTMNAHEAETSPTLRGKYLRERVLCEVIPDPPEDIDLAVPEEGEEPKTLRERLEQHRSDPACSSCHDAMDPPGYLFENYDSMGRYRTTAAGQPIDATGDLDGEPLNNAIDLARVLRDDARVGPCMMLQLYRHANGRLEQPGESSVLAQLNEDASQQGYDFRLMLKAIVLSKGFRTVANLDAGEAP